MSASNPQGRPPSLKDEWLKHKADRLDFLKQSIDTVDRWIGAIQDPELGTIGADLITAFKASHCRETIDVRYIGLAHYTSYSLNENSGGFINEIIYGPSAQEDLVRLYSAKVHEATHALQKVYCPALHATPFNRSSNIIICPEDWVKLQILCERDAYTKQALFNSLLARDLEEVADLTKNDPVSVETFNLMRANGAPLADILTQVAEVALEKSFYWDDAASVYQFKDHYQDFILENYDAGISLRDVNAPIEFVRVDVSDLAAVGINIGPSRFTLAYVQALFDNALDLKPEVQDSLNALNSRLGITDKRQLRSFQDAKSSPNPPAIQNTPSLP